MQNIFFVKAWLMNATVQENILFGQAKKPARLAHLKSRFMYKA